MKNFDGSSLQFLFLLLYISCVLFCSWTGDKALKELQEANISQQCFPILQECAVKVHVYNDDSVVLSVSCHFTDICNPFRKAIKAAADSESGLAHLSGMSATTLEGNWFLYNGLFISLKHSQSPSNISCYPCRSFLFIELFLSRWWDSHTWLPTCYSVALRKRHRWGLNMLFCRLTM